jgi:hypothetical protein
VVTGEAEPSLLVWLGMVSFFFPFERVERAVLMVLVMNEMK